MKKVAGILVFILAAVCSCSDKAISVTKTDMGHRSDLHLAKGSMKLKQVKSIGILLELPRNAVNIRKYSSAEHLQSTSCKELAFDLAVVKASPLVYNDDVAIWWGSVKIYKKEDFFELAQRESTSPWNTESSNSWNIGKIKKAKELYGVIQRIEVGKRNLGYDQVIYFVCKKSNDGRILTAVIARSEYIDSNKVKSDDLTVIRDILKSINFI